MEVQTWVYWDRGNRCRNRTYFAGQCSYLEPMRPSLGGWTSNTFPSSFLCENQWSIGCRLKVLIVCGKTNFWVDEHSFTRCLQQNFGTDFGTRVYQILPDVFFRISLDFNQPTYQWRSIFDVEILHARWAWRLRKARWNACGRAASVRWAMPLVWQRSFGGTSGAKYLKLAKLMGAI